MLHYRIMSYDSDYDWVQLVELVSLRDAASIEREFVKRLNGNLESEPFYDELSALLLREMDGSQRVGEYAVQTPKGKGCITCLGTGIKFGLMVIDRAKAGKAVITKPYAVGLDHLTWLARHGDFTLVLTDNECGKDIREVLTLVNNGDADLEYQGQVYSAYGIKECIEALADLINRNEEAADA